MLMPQKLTPQQRGRLDSAVMTVEIRSASVNEVLLDRDRADARSRPQQTFWSTYDHCDVSSASHQAACLARPAAAGEALPSLMRYTRPLSVCSETRLRPSFLRTTPARKPRTECCCHSVAVTRDAIVAPAGVRSIAIIRACLVLVPADLDDAGADRLRVTSLRVFRAGEWAARFGLVFGLVMASSEVMRRRSPHHLSPAQAITRQGQTPKRALAAPSFVSNAPIKTESQSILSKIIAHFPVSF